MRADADLRFGSFLAWSPHGLSPAELASRSICREIKRDGYLRRQGGDEPIIGYTVRRLRDCMTPELAELFAPGVLLVPVPGSAPLPPGQPRAPWVARRICEALLAAGLGGGIELLLERRTAVPKSACAPPRERPRAADHYASFAVAALETGGAPLRITLVDDVITRGATLLGAAARIANTLPGVTVCAFALLRTQNPVAHPCARQRFCRLVDPVCSWVTLGRYGAWRQDP